MSATLNARLADADVSVTISREDVDVSYGHHVIAEDWTFTDRQGHVHDATLEHIAWVKLYDYWCEDCCDMHDHSEQQCTLCGARVEPKYIFRRREEIIPGLTHGEAVVRRWDEAGITIETTYVLRPEQIDLLTKEQAVTAAFLASVEADGYMTAQNVMTGPW